MSNVQQEATQPRVFEDMMDASDAILDRWSDGEDLSEEDEELEATDDSLVGETDEETSDTYDDDEDLEEVEDTEEDPDTDDTEDEDEPETDQEDDETEVELSDDTLVEIQETGYTIADILAKCLFGLMIFTIARIKSGEEDKEFAKAEFKD